MKTAILKLSFVAVLYLIICVAYQEYDNTYFNYKWILFKIKHQVMNATLYKIVLITIHRAKCYRRYNRV